VAKPVDEMPKAKAAAQKGVDADPNLAEAYTSRAFVKLSYDWDWLGAESDFQQALKLNSKYPTAHQWYASYLMQMGKFNRAKAELEEAHKLDPLSPIISSNTGLYSYYEHNYDDAISNVGVRINLAQTSLGRLSDIGHDVKQTALQTSNINTSGFFLPRPPSADRRRRTAAR
jgi:serine/threonine-protein kinase